MPLVALECAAIDTVFTRYAYPHRPHEAGLFFGAILLWLAFTLVALFPATLAARLDRRERRWGEEYCGLLFWTAAPVLAHGMLDRYTDIGQDLAGLTSLAPWLGALGVLLGIGLPLRYFAPKFSNSPGKIAGPALAVAFLAPGLLLPWGKGARPRWEGAADATGKPNLLLLVWDTTRAPSLALYGSERGAERDPTPNLTALAQDALVFDESRSVSVFTLSSHVSMLTGVFPSQHTAVMTHMRTSPGRTPSIAALLAKEGYRTGAFVGTDVLRAGTGIADGFEVYDDQVDPLVTYTSAWALVHDVQSVLALKFPAFHKNGLPHWIQTYQRPAGEVLERALAWTQEDDPRPWFCFVNMYDVHWPYLPTDEGREHFVEPYAGEIDGYLFRSDRFRAREFEGPPAEQLDAEDDRHLTDLYTGELYDLDRDVDAFLAALDLERTAIVVTADHGEAFGEGDEYEHNGLLEPQVRIPLIVRQPTAAHPRRLGRSSFPTSGVDVAPTLLALAGVAAPEHMVGRDLIAPELPEARSVLVEDLDQVRPERRQLALYRGTWKLVRTGSGEDALHELFDLTADSIGLEDRAAEHPELVAEMAAELDELRATWAAEEAVLDGAGGGSADALGALGYTEND